MTYSIDQILSLTRGRIANPEVLRTLDAEFGVKGPAGLAGSTRQNVAFFFSRAFENELGVADPGVLITSENFIGFLQKAKADLWHTCVIVVCADPYSAMAKVSEIFAKEISSVARISESEGSSDEEAFIHPSAVVAESAVLEKGVRIGPHCVVEEDVSIGEGTVLYPGCTIGPKTKIGKQCVFFPRVTLYEWTKVGDRVRIHAGAVIGADGFGYAPRVQDRQVMGHQKIYHLGNVVIGDDVEIGANTCVDRATFGETRLEKNSKVDNLVQIGHNATLDEGAILCGGVCVAGNAKIGKFAYVAGVTGISNHVHLGDHAKIGACSLISKDVEPGDTALGNPQRRYHEHFRVHAMLSRLLEERRKK